MAKLTVEENDPPHPHLSSGVRWSPDLNFKSLYKLSSSTNIVLLFYRKCVCTRIQTIFIKLFACMLEEAEACNKQQDVTEGSSSDKKSEQARHLKCPPASLSLVTILFLVFIFIKEGNSGFENLSYRQAYFFFFFTASVVTQQVKSSQLDQLVDCWWNNNNELFATISLFYYKTWEISLKQWSVTKWLVTVSVKQGTGNEKKNPCPENWNSWN